MSGAGIRKKKSSEILGLSKVAATEDATHFGHYGEMLMPGSLTSVTKRFSLYHSTSADHVPWGRLRKAAFFFLFA